MYHNSCKKKYISDSKRVVPFNLTKAHTLAMAAVSPHIESIISYHKAIFLATLHTLYLETLAENGFPESGYDSRRFEEKIKKLYGDLIVIMKISKKYGKVVFSENIDALDAMAIVENKSLSDSILEEAAEILRSDVLKMKEENCCFLPYPLSTNDNAKGEGTIH